MEEQLFHVFAKAGALETDAQRDRPRLPPWGRFHIPELYCSVGASRDKFKVPAEGHAGHLFRVTNASREKLPALGFPELDCLIEARSGENAAVWAERDARYAFTVSRKRPFFLLKAVKQP